MQYKCEAHILVSSRTFLLLLLLRLVVMCFLHFSCNLPGMRYLVGIRECTDVPSITLRSFSKTKSRGPRPKGLTSSGRSKLTGAFPSGRSFIDVAAAVDADSFRAAAGFLDTEPMPDRPSLLLKEEAEEEISAPDDSEPEVEVARDAVRAEALSPRLDPAAKPQPETQDGSDGVPRFFQNSQLSFPALKQTSMTVHDITLLDAMGRWNLPVSRLMCCAFHAHTLELKSGIKRFSKMQCRRTFPPGIGGSLQCQGCGMIDVSDDEDDMSTWRCYICGSDSQASIDRSTSSPMSSSSRVRL
ncbi:unnamed protein product [Polarella glacialis]|uniref:Uncharacterized protein n=1 Tax=Polarella glacialis TaxID=89957 RepID=A0A813K0A4_POLGL|nr:unnamed protein product [Polarella glacialis]